MNDPSSHSIESLTTERDVAVKRAGIAERQAAEFEDALHAMAEEASRKLDAALERARRAESGERNQRERREALVTFIRAELRQFRTYRSGSLEAAVERLVSQLHAEVAE